MKRFLIVVALIAAILVFSVTLFPGQGKGESMQGSSTGSAYTQKDLMDRFTRDYFILRSASRRHPEIETLKEILAKYPQSSFAPVWQLAIATRTDKLEDFQKVIYRYPGNDFIHAIAYTKMGKIHRAEGEEEKARKSFQEALFLIDICIMSDPKNAAYNYYKAIIKLIKQGNERLDCRDYPDGRPMDAEILSELKRGSIKDYFFLEMTDTDIFNILMNTSMEANLIRELSRRLKLQGVYYEKKGRIGRAIETYEMMLKIGRHLESGNQGLMEMAGAADSMLYVSRVSLKRLFEKNNIMMERKRELEIAGKAAEERREKRNLIRSLVRNIIVVINKDLSDLPPEMYMDKKETIRKAVEEAIDIIEKNNLIKDRNSAIRILISYLLSRLGGERAIAILREGLNDEDPYVRFFVKKMLEKMH